MLETYLYLGILLWFCLILFHFINSPSFAFTDFESFLQNFSLIQLVQNGLLSIGLCQPLDGITNLTYNLFCFLTTIIFYKEQKALLTLNWDRCCHLAFWLCLIPFFWRSCPNLYLSRCVIVHCCRCSFIIFGTSIDVYRIWSLMVLHKWCRELIYGWFDKPTYILGQTTVVCLTCLRRRRVCSQSI